MFFPLLLGLGPASVSDVVSDISFPSPFWGLDLWTSIPNELNGPEDLTHS